MKQIFVAMAILALAIPGYTQTQQDPVLYGLIEKNQLRVPPYNVWFAPGYDNYVPDPSVINGLKKLDCKDVSIDIFLGTWCGDSRREVPRFQKMLDVWGISENNVRIIGLGGTDSLYKQSPTHQEKGKGIFRVPVFIIYKRGVEVNRINEFPALSLEKDIYQILSLRQYIPNYHSFSLIRTWLDDGSLLDKNTSSNGLAVQLRSLTGNERELNNLGYLLMAKTQKAEALKIFQANASLYPESALVLSSLGEGYYKNGDTANAVRYLERSLEINKDPLLVKPILKVLYLAKGIVD
jgi:thiol-disulfide isomerase/thioredoxin